MFFVQKHNVKRRYPATKSQELKTKLQGAETSVKFRKELVNLVPIKQKHAFRPSLYELLLYLFELVRNLQNESEIVEIMFLEYIVNIHSDYIKILTSH